MCFLSISILNYPARQDIPRHTNAVECLKYRTLILPCSVVVMSWHNFPAAIGHKAIFPAIRTCMPWHTLPPIARNFTLCNHMQPQTRSRLTHGSVETSCRHTTSRTAMTIAICMTGHFQAYSRPSVISGRSIRILHAAGMATTFNFVALSGVYGQRRP